MHYVPILRGKAGELTALSEISAAVREVVRPVLEVVPGDRLRDVVQTFSTHAGNLLPGDLAITVDFADYGVTHPVPLRAGLGRARANLRFTASHGMPLASRAGHCLMSSA